MMIKKRVNAFINAIINLRDSATDEQAVNATILYPVWQEGCEYKVGTRVVHNDVMYKVTTAHTSQADWTPDVAVSLFASVLTADDGTALDWVQPDSTNPYMTGNKVVFEGKTWISTIDNNVWAPGVYGWEEVV